MTSAPRAQEKGRPRATRLNWRRRLLLGSEWILLFVTLPILLYWRINLIYFIVPPAVAYAAWLTWRDPSLTWANTLGPRWRQRLASDARPVLRRFALLAPLITLGTWWLLPEGFLRFPREQIGLWVVVMIVYPLWSVLPQEFLFRTFFWHRYKRLLPAQWALIVASALCFGWAHLFFGNDPPRLPLGIWAAPLSAIGGFLFACTYARSRNLYACWLEHALYGNLAFTLGLGEIFYYGPRPDTLPG